VGGNKKAGDIKMQIAAACPVRQYQAAPLNEVIA